MTTLGGIVQVVPILSTFLWVVKGQFLQKKFSCFQCTRLPFYK